MNSQKIIKSILLLQALAIIPVYWLKLAFTNVPIRDGLYLSTIFMAVIAGFYLINKYGLKGPRRITVVCFTLGLLCTFIGELIYEYYYIALNSSPAFPSFSYYLGLVYYIFYLIALINELRLAHINWGKLDKRILIVPTIIAIILACVVCYAGIYNAYDPSESLLANLVSMAFGVGDLILMVISLFLIVLIKEYRGGRFARIWLYFIIGVCFSIGGDIFNDYFMNQYNAGIWLYKSTFDTVNMLSFLFIARTLYEYGFSIVDAYKIAAKGPNKDKKPLTISTVSSSSK